MLLKTKIINHKSYKKKILIIITISDNLYQFDCISDIIKNRDSNDHATSSKMSIIANFLKNRSTDKKMMISMAIKKKETSGDSSLYSTFSSSLITDKLNLDFILNLIDGILEMLCRILIITTNFPDKIDPALICLGRIDIKMEMARAKKYFRKSHKDE